MKVCRKTIPTGLFRTLIVLCTLASRVTAQDCEGWSTIDNPPGGRFGHALAFDSIRGVTVMFGGSNVTSLLDETLEWDGQFWNRVKVSGPGARAGHAMTYDSNRRVVVLFGGFDESGELADTWEWNGVMWSQRTGPAPQARYGHSMTFDSNRRVVVLFGGRNDGAFVSRTVWEWNGTTWSQRTATGPSPRDGQGLAFDPVRNLTVLFGGHLGPRGFSNETWEWNGASWTQRVVTGPRAQASPLLAWDSLRSTVVLFGQGATPGIAGELWDWNGTSWIARTSAPPIFRDGQAMVYDSTRRRLVLFGGDLPARNDHWEWDATNWTKRGGDLVSPRPGSAVVYDSVRHRAVQFGGSISGSTAGQTLEWDGAQWLTAASTGPSARDEHALAFDAVNGQTILFGGRVPISDTATGSSDYMSELGDTWVWNGTNWSVRGGAGPSARFGHGMTQDTRRNITVLFGGATHAGTSEVQSRETWEWSGTAWTRRSTTGPTARTGPAMAFDALRAQTVLFGGKECIGNCCQAKNDTWVWSGSSWTQRVVSGPAARFGASMAYDTISGIVLLYGGKDENGNTFEDLWQWNGTSWSQRADLGPAARFGHSLVYDTANHMLLLFGGVGGFGDAWEYGCDASCGGGTLLAPEPELYANCPGGPCYATKNRYISFIPPAPPCGAADTALRVTFSAMPGPSNCPSIPDYSRFNGTTMWVGPEHLYSTDGETLNTPAGVFELQSSPRFRDWRSIAGGVVFVSDCNIVPCASYTIQAVTESGIVTGDYSPPLILSTTSTWGDVTGPNATPPDGVIDAIDIVGAVDRFRGVLGSPSKAACDISGNRPWQGVFASIDALDVTAVIDAFRGIPYAYSGPSAPALCPGPR